MNRIKLKLPKDDAVYCEATDRIVRVFSEYNLSCSNYQAYMMWQMYSDDCDANWLTQPSSDVDLFNDLKEYWEVAHD